VHREWKHHVCQLKASQLDTVDSSIDYNESNLAYREVLLMSAVETVLQLNPLIFKGQDEEVLV